MTEFCSCSPVFHTSKWLSLYCFQGHVETIFDCKFKPDDPNLLATASFDGTIKIWDTNTLTAVYTSPGNEGVVYSLSWAPGLSLSLSHTYTHTHTHTPPFPPHTHTHTHTYHHVTQSCQFIMWMLMEISLCTLQETWTALQEPPPEMELLSGMSGKEKSSPALTRFDCQREAFWEVLIVWNDHPHASKPLQGGCFYGSAFSDVGLWAEYRCFYLNAILALHVL